MTAKHEAPEAPEADTILKKITEYKKLVAYVAGIVAQVLALGLLSGTAEHVAQVALAVLTGLGIERATNARPTPADTETPDTA